MHLCLTLSLLTSQGTWVMHLPTIPAPTELWSKDNNSATPLCWGCCEVGMANVFEDLVRGLMHGKDVTGSMWMVSPGAAQGSIPQHQHEYWALAVLDFTAYHTFSCTNSNTEKRPDRGYLSPISIESTEAWRVSTHIFSPCVALYVH